MEIPNVFTGYGSPFLDGRKYAKMADLAVDTGLKGSFFHIDDLLNFSNEEIAGPIEENSNNWANDVTADSSTVTVMETPSRKSPANTNSFGTSNALETDGHCTADFFIPCDDLAELEWLSNFVEDSISMETTPEPVFSPNLAAQKADQQGPDSNEDSNSCSGKTSSFSPEISVPGRARSKRPRPHISSNWYSHMFTQGSVPEPQTSANSLSINAGLCSKSTILDGAEYGLPEKLKQVKSSKPGTRKKTPENIHARRCMHCGIQRTPQWRAGPMGPKTLCNACGVRYKSGRLLPEYRPAASPTFVPSEHSNSHKKVLQMRHQKESTEPLELPEKSSDDEYFLLHTTDRRDFSCHLI